MNLTNRIDLLFSKYIKREITRSELEELLVWLYGIEEDDKDTLAAPMRELWEKAKAGQLTSTAGKVDWEQVYKNILGNDEDKIISIKKRPLKIWTWAAAAVIVFGMSVGGYYILHKPSSKVISKTRSDDPAKILPGTNKAILTLADGKQIVLDTAANGTLTQQGGVKIIKLDSGQLAYQQLATGNGQSAIGNRQLEIQYNTISTPKGGQYQIVLADGSKVWLNAASSLRFPTAFNKERNVELTGEGYFEVTKNPSMPFHVKVNDLTVEVLGTHFNVNAYADEEGVKTTLLEGSVKVSTIGGQQSRVIKPGQQALLTDNNQLNVANANTALAVAWMKGYFYFDKADLKTILRQASRWYDLDIEYQANVPDRLFSGKMQRDLSLADFLRLFKEADIHFRLEGKKLIVLK